MFPAVERAEILLVIEIIDTLDEPLDGRLLQYLLRGPVADGGQWDMVVNLVEKYGLVRVLRRPRSGFPKGLPARAGPSSRLPGLVPREELRFVTRSTVGVSPTNNPFSGNVNWLITAKLRHAALTL